MKTAGGARQPAGKMVKTGIKIFARLRPTKRSTGVYEVCEREDGLNVLNFTVPRSEGSGIVNNKREAYTFRFTRVFDCKASQEEVFNEVSRGVIDNCLEGYNGTIFAYGQTGSGKTFTITGGVERYNDRGLIPRSLSYLFQKYSESPGTLFTTHISYLEIYNESGYDLLDPRHEAAKLEDLPKVTLLEDRESVIHLRNLSLHPANNEEEALNWLFIGDTNRVMAETPMNMASTRSHCIFTIHISSRQPGSDIIRRAKLHLVDLAGSERVGRTGVEGTLLTESKYINLSLHFLEQVIVALSDKSRSHIPYRNSMMTSVLRDSLGGNCMTSMIATCSIEKRSIDETISTCRFSQRVALVKNEAMLNEELDPRLMVQHLKQQVAELKEELSLATGGEEREGELDTTERDGCDELVKVFVEDPSPEARLLVGGDMRKIQLCFTLLKARVKTTPAPFLPPPSSSPNTHSQTLSGDNKQMTSDPMTSELKKLEEIIRQKDEEINMLIKRLKKYEEDMVTKPTIVVDERDDRKEERGEEGEGKGVEKVENISTQQEEDETQKTWRSELSRARQEAFDIFRKDCPLMIQVTHHKTELKTRYAEAKGLGEQVQKSRTTINRLKSQLEKYRISRGLAGITQGVMVSSNDSGPDERELETKSMIESEKTRFKSLYQTLRGMKTEIEHIQHLLDTAKVKVQQEFEIWWQKQVAKDGSTRTAWKTPPTTTSHFPGHNSELLRHLTTSGSRSMSEADYSGHHSKYSGHHYKDSGHHTTSGRRSEADHSGHHYKDSGHHTTSGRSSRSEADHSGHHSKDSGHSTDFPLTYRTPVKPQPLFSHPIPFTTSSHHTITSPVQQLSKFNPETTINHSAGGHMIPLTGDARADADIIAFYKARQHLINRGHH